MTDLWDNRLALAALSARIDEEENFVALYLGENLRRSRQERIAELKRQRKEFVAEMDAPFQGKPKC